MALRIVDDEENFPTMATRFRDVYPGDYSGMGPQGAPAIDPIGAHALRNAPMHQAGMGQRYEDIVPFTGNNFIGNLFNPSGSDAKLAYAQRARKFNTQIDDQAQKDLQMDLNIMTAMKKAPPGQRDPIIKLYQRYNQQRGIELDPELLKFYKKADEDDWAAAQWAGQEFLKSHPDVDQAGANKVINSNPAALSEVLSLIAQAKENKLKNEQTELENQLWQKAGEAFSRTPTEAPTRPQEPLQVPPVQQPSPQLQQAPRGPQEASRPSQRGVAFNQMVDELGDQYSIPQPVRQMVKASGSMETIGYDPQAVSPKGAGGTLQFMPKTAQRFGVKDPTDDRQAIVGAFKYYTVLGKMFPERPDLQFASYNAGEGAVQEAGNKVPNYPETQGYVQKGMQYLQGLPKPHSESVAQAPAQVLDVIRSYDVRINGLQSFIDTLPREAAMLPKLRALKESLQKDQEGLRKDQERIEKRYEDKPSSGVLEAATELFPETPWVNLKPGQKQAAIVYRREVEESGKVAAAAAHGRDAVLRKPLTTEENRQYGSEPGSTQGWLADNRGKVQQRVELPTAQQTKADGYSIVYRMSGRLTEQLADPEMRKALQPVIGTILSDPQAWYNRFVGKKIEGLTDTQTRFASALALQMIQLRKELIGTAQTAQELTAAEGFLTSLADVTPETILAKIEGIRDYVYLAHDSLLDNAEDLGQRVPKRLPKPKGFELEAKPTAQTPDKTPSAMPLNPFQEAARKDRERRKP